MITKDEMFAPLLEVCPTFAADWQEFLSACGPNPNAASREIPYYLALNALARHLGSRLQAGETGDFGAVFGVVERWHIEGDAYVQNAATVGLLEDLQNPVNTGTASPADFVRWLGPETLKGWCALERFWGHPETAFNTKSSSRSKVRSRHHD